MSPCFRSYSNGKFCQLQSNRIVQRNLRQVLIVEICQTQEIRPCAAQPTSTLSQCSCRGATRTNLLNPGVQPLPQPRGWRLIAWPFCHEPLGIEGLQQCQQSAKKRAAQPRGAPLASRAGSSRSTQRRAWPAECKHHSKLIHNCEKAWLTKEVIAGLIAGLEGTASTCAFVGTCELTVLILISLIVPPAAPCTQFMPC